MPNVAGKVVAWLMENEAIKEDEKELYEYAFRSLIMLIVPLLLAIGMGILFGVFIESLVLILPFMLIRKFSGGYHAKRQTTCLVISSTLLFTCFWIAEKVSPNTGLHVVVLVASISLSVFSPVDSENRRLDYEETVSFRKSGRILVTIFLLIYVLLCAIKGGRFASYLAMGILLPAGLQIPCILQKEK